MIHIPLIASLMICCSSSPEVQNDGVDQPNVQLIEFADEEVLPGLVRPLHQVTLSSSFDTLLGELKVVEGQEVKKGQVLAVLDDRVIRASLRLAETQANRRGQIDHAQASLEKAEDALNRVQMIHEMNAATEPELVAAELDYKVAKASLLSANESYDEAQASLQLAQARLEEHMVRAPFDGVVIRVHSKQGAMVSPNDPLVEIVSKSGLYVEFYLPVSVVSDLQVGGQYALSVEDPGLAVFAAEVRYIEPRMDPVSRTVRVVFDFDEHMQGSTKIYAGSLALPATHIPELDESLLTRVDSDASDMQE